MIPALAIFVVLVGILCARWGFTTAKHQIAFVLFIAIGIVTGLLLASGY